MTWVAIEQQTYCCLSLNVLFERFNPPKNNWVLIEPFSEHLKYASLIDPL